ncbi:MAG TPA: YezD family protein [Candidatus Hydrogenedentes bacterium]|nr:YezD family protein [Candidatus Hydrogenedentota bacterium]
MPENGAAGANQQPKGKAPGEVEDLILQTVRGIRYGSVEIVIHNAQVVQVERREKLRFASHG